MQRVLIDDLEVDASLSEQHKDTVEITRHPVEEGADVTDHFRPLPSGLVVNGLLTNTPSNAQEAEDEGEDRTKAFGSGRANDGYARLREILKAGNLITITTALRTYPNMMLVSIDVPADSKVGDAVRFTATFDEIRFVKTEIVNLEILTHPNRVPQKPIKKEDKGKQVPEQKPADYSSNLKDIFDGTGATSKGSGLDRNAAPPINNLPTE